MLKEAQGWKAEGDIWGDGVGRSGSAASYACLFYTYCLFPFDPGCLT